MPAHELHYFTLLLVTGLYTPVRAEITSLDAGNIDDILNNAGVALVNFYADWCRFSQMLHPIFEEASNVVREEYPDTSQVVFARVDCDQHTDIAQRYRISKYPTLKLFRNGMMMKREYRGQRSVTAIADFIRQQKVDPISEIQSLEEVTKIDRSRRTIIGYFEQKNSDNYHAYEKVANILRDDCAFMAAFGEVSKPERFSGDNVIYKPLGENAPDMVYLGSLTNFDLVYAWAQDKCVPLVREITFENGEVYHPSPTQTCHSFSLSVSLSLSYSLHTLPEDPKEVASSPPESSFQKLAPSETRYTILSRDRDEL
uniref:Endoplasmic reticulum protein 44 n=1 Tax=Astyanax mexicanus TaxID=7994 RepID=A0A8B9K3K2_ASTMX